MKLKIGAMGNASDKILKRHRTMANVLGKAIAGSDCIIMTGACPGFPFEAAKGAKEAGGLVVGISPGLSFWEHENKYKSPMICV